MDVIVTRLDGRPSWSLADLLGRSMGAVVSRENGEVVVEPAGRAKDTMAGMRCGPYASLDEALAAIETHTRGVCRRTPGMDGNEA